MTGRVFYLYFQKGMRCSYPTLYRRLHGRREIRITVNGFGEARPKTFEYLGVPHVDIMQGVVTVKTKDAPKIEALFREFGVSYIKIVPKRVEKSGR